ncbi:hypothetical protein N9Y60_01985 [Crocinitomicaceae bacterium]|nr:hypothetical protein [Crocinitomicaceae bacterium]
MKKTLLLAALSCSVLSFAQNNQSYVELAVEESIELAVKSVEVNLFVTSFYSQLEQAKEMEFYDDYYGYEEDYYYEYMLEESPKEVTKEMKKEYEERQASRESMEAELEKFEAEFKMYTIKDLMKDLDEEGIKYAVVNDFDESGDEGDYYEFEYYGYDYNTDTVLQIVTTSSNEYDRVSSFSEDKMAVAERTGEVERESMEGKYEEALPKLAAKAKAQGNLIANALGQQLGKLISCSNVHPEFDYQSPKEVVEYLDYEYEYDYYYGNPFEQSSEFTVQLVFRFAVN